MRACLATLAVAVLTTTVVSAPSTGPTESPCYLTVLVPVGTSLSVNGIRTEQMTAVRKFVSPPLQHGKKFYYTFDAAYTSNAELVTRRQQIEVTAGANLTIDMMQAALVKNAAPDTPQHKGAFESPKSGSPKSDSPKKSKSDSPKKSNSPKSTTF
jgi:uncharacterized protein (TIGR03000 family)